MRKTPGRFNFRLHKKIRASKKPSWFTPHCLTLDTKKNQEGLISNFQKK
jgi:hypothetical protein